MKYLLKATQSVTPEYDDEWELIWYDDKTKKITREIRSECDGKEEKWEY